MKSIRKNLGYHFLDITMGNFFKEEGCPCCYTIGQIIDKFGVRAVYLQVTSEVAAEKQIQQLLFPRSRRKKLSHGVALRNVASF